MRGKEEPEILEAPGLRVYVRFYYLEDHLGNIRVTVDQLGGVAAYDACPPSFWRDYDPYGMGLDGRSGNISNIDTRFKFISAENDVEHGMYLLGPRLYDQRIGLFRSPDPMQDIYAEYSPFHYGFNNPMRFVDPTGMQAEDENERKKRELEEKEPEKVYELEEIVVTATRLPLRPEDVWLVSGAFYAAAQSGAFLSSEQQQQGKEALFNMAMTLVPTGRFIAAGGQVARFIVHSRVFLQLKHVRLGSLASKLTVSNLQKLVNNPAAKRFFDTKTGNINVIQEIEGRLLRITVASDEMKIISVGPIRANQVTNAINSGRFVSLP